MWSPCDRIAVMAQNVAAIPDEVQTAADPPSSAAMRCSSTADRRIRDATVGMAAALEVEDRRRRIGVRKYIRRRLVNRCRPRTELVIDRLSGVQASVSK